MKNQLQPAYLYIFALALLWQFALVGPIQPAQADKPAKHPQTGESLTQSRSAARKSKEDQAIDLVWKLPEVKLWLKQFPGGTSKLGGHAAATADHDKGELYNVHVYEDLPDHTATFGWYSVNLKSGRVTKQI